MELFAFRVIGNTARAVDKKFFRQATTERFKVGEDVFLEVHHPPDGGAVGKKARGIDGWAVLLFFGACHRVGFAPLADGVEVFEGKTEGINFEVASCAGFFLGVGSHQVPDSFAPACVWSNGWNGFGRRRRWIAEHVFQNPFSTEHRLGIDAIGGGHHDARLTEDAAVASTPGDADTAHGKRGFYGGQRHLEEPVHLSAHGRVSVEEVGVDEVGDGAVFSEEFSEEKLGFEHQRLLGVRGEGPQRRVRHDFRDEAGVQPLAYEALHKIL
ncbi:MAG: hypothetical protein RLZZ399_1820 [Verrucomicrobiota bacterium]